TSSRVHAASLVDPAHRSPELLQLLDIELSLRVVGASISFSCSTHTYLTPTFDWSTSSTLDPGAPARASSPAHKCAFASFVRTLHSRVEVALPTILTALVYVARARAFLSISLAEYTLERVWLGALITASKYTQDSTLKNVHWALCTGVFGVGDVGRIEREFLEVLEWVLGVREGEVVRVVEALGGGRGAGGATRTDGEAADSRPRPCPHLRPRARAIHLEAHKQRR
ncbi:hypothetical protein FB451DRAFT_1043094, partial [Mycena latifolia]